MDPKPKNIRKDPFGQAGVRPITNQTTAEDPPTLPQTHNLPPSSVKQPISNKNLPNPQAKGTPLNQEIEAKQDDQSLKEYETLKNYNCSKIYIRTTCERFPANSGILKDASFPIGMIINPYSNHENEIPVINYGDKEIPRCSSPSCRGYINPFIKWIEGGEKWICNLCGYINDTAEYYYSRLDKDNNRVDMFEKADISSGSYEFIANGTYMKKDKSVAQPVYIFIIDVSIASYQNGFLTGVLETIKELIKSESFQNSEKVKIGLITYDSSVNFYCMNEKQTQPYMMCVSEEEVFLPTPYQNLLVNPVASKTLLMNTIEMIQSSSANNTCKDSSKFFNALSAGYLIAKNTGAKLIVFSASIGMIQSPKMKSSKISSIAKDELIYTATDDRQLSTMGVNMTNENISCDIFLTCESYANLVTLNQLCDNTNGNLYFYKNFRIETHYKNLFNQLRRVATRPMGLESVIRTRFSKGYKISNFVTPVLISNNDLIVCPALDSDQTYAFGLDMAEQIQTANQPIDAKKSTIGNDSFVYIQTAVLYTHQDNTRRIRIHNLCLPLAHRLVDLYESIDSESLAAYYTKLTIDRIFKTKKISNSVLASEASYKALISSVMSALIKKELPNNLSYLPLYFLGMIKHRVCCKDELERKLDVDLSNYLRIKLQKMSVNDLMPFICSRIFPVHQILQDNIIGNLDEDGMVNLPQTVNSHKSSLESDGVYLIDNGFLLMLYISNKCDRSLISSIFKVNDTSDINGPLIEDILFVDPDENLQRIINIIDYIRGTKAIFQNLIFVFEGTDAERIVKESLIEDNFCPWVKIDYKTFYMNTVESNVGGYRQGLR